MSRPPELTAASVIRLRREGGLAHFPGLTCPRFIHCSRYSEAQRDELWQLLARVEVRAGTGPSEATDTDRRRFCLSVEDESGTSVWMVTVAEEAAPQGLVEWWRRAGVPTESERAP